MANQDKDFARIASKETNNQNDTRGSGGPRVLAGVATPRKNPMKGGGINRAKSKSGLQ